MKAPLSNEALLQRLVGFDSTSRNSNLPIADFLCEYLERPGVRVERNDSPDGTKTNVIATVGPTEATERDGLMLSGHTDVVPADEPEWKSDPFSLTIRDDRYYGRGACDMKGFVCLAANTAASLDPSTLTHPLVLIFTYDEEIGTLGAQHFARTWQPRNVMPRSAVIGEPTSLRVVRLHKGHLSFRIAVSGQSAHSGYPHLGRNAVEPTGRLIVAFSELRRQLEADRPANHEYFPEIPFVAFNVARVKGGTAINIVPDQCVLECGARILPGMTSEELIDRVRTITAEVLGDAEYSFELESDSPPLLLADDADIYQTLCRTVGQRQTVSVSYATDGGWFQTMGFDCAIWGPGSIEVAHKPNESISISEFDRADELLRGVVHRYCLPGER